ncbi:hypothetical protein [Nostoc sp.]|uniref:hypothetical protein n=1 Tax=Nostoc sp. TaxID=1180 RepID=UPI002FF76701
MLSDDDWFIRQGLMPELAKRWKYEPGMFEFFCNLAIQDNFERKANWQVNPRQTALEAIIEHYPNNPQTLPLLCDRANNDPDEQVREFAQKKLAQLEK